MISDRRSQPHYITSQNDLCQLVENLLLQPIIAVDTESNSLYAYQEQVCLIQFSTPSVDFLVDPLALHDLQPLSEVFANSQIEKVFHAAEYDLICLKRDYGFEFYNLFDTVVAARILGRKAVGLGSILEAEFGVKIDKRFQRANWGRRPLPQDMLNYAHLDTHYLIPLRNILYNALVQKKLLALAMEDFNRLCCLENLVKGIQTENPKVIDPWRIKGATDLTPQQAAVLLEICSYRDQVARARNQPLFKIFSDRTLAAIAQKIPPTVEALRQIPGMSSRQIKLHGNALIKAIRRGLHSKPLYPPRNHRPDDKYLNRLDAIRRWRKQAGLEMGVPSDVILPRDLMLEIASENPKNPAELSSILHNVPWRKEEFGDEIIQFLTSRD